jgi:hypothetical protein
MPLQAADLTAWIQRTYSCNNKSLGEFDWVIDELKGIGVSPYCMILDEPWFIEMARSKGEVEQDVKRDLTKAYREYFGFEWPPKTKQQRKKHSGR